ncbi:transmembrane protein 14C isoform X1 [Marmota marmota marmota]|uniref:transmembrane protein 14C isoform X1 n=1 Tax=Marmota marmota marmota TaxID=9994 RepID=UPI0020930374|nr:transmembrane protein 14C isoform X1 [Marmota marmota marmota]
MQKNTGPMVPLHYFGFGYAALVATGGIIGYAKAGSVPSLAAGLFFGSLAGLGAYQLSQDPRNIWVFLATSGTLAGIMGMRFYHSGKFMPAGLIAGARWLTEDISSHTQEHLRNGVASQVLQGGSFMNIDLNEVKESSSPALHAL